MPHVSGNVLPISYQCGLVSAFTNVLSADINAFSKWLKTNNLTLSEVQEFQFFSISNLYIPKIRVDQDRLFIMVPRIQFWVSFLPERDTLGLLESVVLGKTISIGDTVSAVSFRVSAIDVVSPVEYTECMEYQSLSPVVVKALRQNNTMEYLAPSNPYFSQFLIDELIERWERYHKCPYMGSRNYSFVQLALERRKAVTVTRADSIPDKVVGYMLKFRLIMSAELQQFAYVAGLGDETQLGFGYLELLKKRK